MLKWGELGYLWTSYRQAKDVKDEVEKLGVKAKVGRVGREEAWYVENAEGQMLMRESLHAESLKV